jgi:multiple sugar transport system substrate-binding protein
MPHGTQGTVHWVNNVMIYKQTKHPDETKTFMKWSSENQKPLWTDGHTGGLVVRKSYATDPYFQNDTNLKIIFDKWLPVAKTFPYHYTQLSRSGIQSRAKAGPQR